MMTGRAKVMAAVLASSAMLVACWPLPLPDRATVKRLSGPVELFRRPAGAARVEVTIVDHRPRAVLDLADAGTYNGLLFQLSNSVRLASTLTKALAKSPGGAYSLVFEGLPAASGTNYVLTVGLYGGAGDPADPGDAAYADPARRLGEGSAAFELAAGQSKTITIHINAVGALALKSGGQALDPDDLASGQTGVTLDTSVTAARNPEADSLQVYVVDSEGATRSTTPIARSAWPQTGTVTTTLQVPTLGTGEQSAAYTIVVDLLKGSRLLSRRSQAITVASGASPTPAPTPGPTPDPTPTPSPTLSPSPTPTPTPSPTLSPPPTPVPTPTPCPGECCGNQDCPSDEPFCTVAKVCVECLSKANCDNPEPVCSNNSCEPCTSSTQCSIGSVCQAGSCVAVGGCNSSSECSGVTPYCNLVTHECVECLNSENCEDPFYPVCNDGECTDGG